MCGISGIASYAINETNKLSYVEKMCNRQVHRGPDNLSIHTATPIIFGHNRLSLVDLSERSNQPFYDEEHVLVFNGEIYNYLRLKEELTSSHRVQFHTTSDTEVLFYGLIYWGLEETLRRIKGMFAFAFYSDSTKQVVLARDRTGMKPLFYSTKFDSLFFASEIKAFLDIPYFQEFNDKYISLPLFAAFEYSRTITPIKHLNQLEPGNYLVYDVETKKTQIQPYFSFIDYVSSEKYKELSRMSAKEVHGLFEKKMTDTVHLVMAADAKMGSFVSGGVDSSMVTGLAFKKAPISLFTSNVVGKNSELKNSSYLASLLGAELHKTDFTDEDFLSQWVRTTYYYESPILSHSNSIAFQNVSKMASDHACKAVLTGEGSDELFLGYPRLLTKRFDNFILAPYNALVSLYKKIPGLNKYLNLDKRNYHEDFYNLINGLSYELSVKKNSNCFSFIKDKEEREEHALTINMLERGLHSLLRRNDRMGMMHGIESRFPFLYEDILEFAINLPIKYKINFSHRFHNYKHPFLIDKMIVRNLTEKVLDGQLAYIQKKGFPVLTLMNLRIDPTFFKDGFIAESLQLTNHILHQMPSSMEPYFMAKLAAVEIWGSLFFMNQSIETMEFKVLNYIHLNQPVLV